MQIQLLAYQNAVADNIGIQQHQIVSYVSKSVKHVKMDKLVKHALQFTL